jgi:hypothetical protein
MQFHIEIDEPKLMVWLAEGDPQWAAAARDHASVQTRDAILAEAPQRMASHQRLADHIYGRWLDVGSAA